MSIKTVAWIGGLYFHEHLRDIGWDVRFIAHEKADALSWDDIVARAECEPDMVIYADRSLPPPLVGVENFPCLTGFYCIDSHIHSWYPMYAQGFDWCAVSLRGDLPNFTLRLPDHHLLWLPPYPLRGETPPPTPVDKEFNLLFAGKVDPETTPERHEFLSELGKRFPGLSVRQGNFEELFHKARLVLNIAERGDLNFRVFEALASGACLLTPRIEHGQDELFTDGEHLFLYDANDMGGLIELANKLLDDPTLCEAVASAGAALIDEKHRAPNRARTLFDFVENLDAEAAIRQRLDIAHRIHARFMRLVYLHWAEALSGTELGQKYLMAARG